MKLEIFLLNSKNFMYFIETSHIGTVIFMLKAFLMVEKIIAAFYYLKNQCSELLIKNFI